MLLQWNLRDFKSFRGENALDFAPITILCGANSSGKSSVIQSILLIKQTLQHSAANRTVALNGPLVRLGTISDIENYHSRQNLNYHSIGLGWTIRRSSTDNSSHRYYIGSEDIKQISVDFSFDANGPKSERETLEIQPNLATTRVSASYLTNDAEEHRYGAEICRQGHKRKGKNDPEVSDATSNQQIYKVKSLDDDTRSNVLESFPKGKIIGSYVRNFLPSAFLVKFDKGRLDAQTVGSAIFTGRQTRRASALEIPAEVVPLLDQAWDQVSKASNPLFGPDYNPFSQYAALPIPDYTRIVGKLPPSARRNFLGAVDERKTSIDRALVRSFTPEITVAQSRVDIARETVQLNDLFFRFNVQYVGPLRDEPKPLYALQALASPTDVGPKGELTAAVLHLNEKRAIEYVPASSFESGKIVLRKEKVSLRTALIDWMKYLGIAHDFNTNEKGKFGHELRIKTHPALEFQDLTNVGVGVSQILPVLLTCLLADSGSTVIFEQPELHLHPAVQARLADFFLAMGLLGKQCIIETHGEHLIERFRFRIASDYDDEVRDLLKIYFFQQRDGATHTRSVDISEYGAIVDWPDDFFDQSRKESERILQTQLDRRINSVNSKNEVN